MESKENPRPKFANENPWYTEKKLSTGHEIQSKRDLKNLYNLSYTELKKHFS